MAPAKPRQVFKGYVTQHNRLVFFSNDGEYICKQISHDESLFIIRNLKSLYAQYNQKDNLLAPIFGLYRLETGTFPLDKAGVQVPFSVKAKGGAPMLYFVVMKNSFAVNEEFKSYRYVFKGDMLRTTLKKDTALPYFAFKERQVKNDNRGLANLKSEVVALVNTNVNLLKRLNVVGYTLLVCLREHKSSIAVPPPGISTGYPLIDYAIQKCHFVCNFSISDYFLTADDCKHAFAHEIKVNPEKREQPRDPAEFAASEYATRLTDFVNDRLY